MLGAIVMIVNKYFIRLAISGIMRINISKHDKVMLQLDVKKKPFIFKLTAL